MTTFEKRSTGTNYDDRDHHQWDGHQQRASVATAGNVMSAWTAASYDYAEQVLKAQRQFFHSMLAAAGPMFDVARDVMSSDADEGRSTNQLDARSDQHRDTSNRSRKNERYSDDGAAEHHRSSADNNTSDDNASSTNRTAPVASVARKRP